MINSQRQGVFLLAAVNYLFSLFNLADIAKLPIVSLGAHTKTYEFYSE